MKDPSKLIITTTTTTRRKCFLQKKKTTTRKWLTKKYNNNKVNLVHLLATILINQSFFDLIISLMVIIISCGFIEFGVKFEGDMRLQLQMGKQ